MMTLEMHFPWAPNSSPIYKFTIQAEGIWEREQNGIKIHAAPVEASPTQQNLYLIRLVIVSSGRFSALQPALYGYCFVRIYVFLRQWAPCWGWQMPHSVLSFCLLNFILGFTQTSQKENRGKSQDEDYHCQLEIHKQNQFLLTIHLTRA